MMVNFNDAKKKIQTYWVLDTGLAPWILMLCVTIFSFPHFHSFYLEANFLLPSRLPLLTIFLASILPSRCMQSLISLSAGEQKEKDGERERQKTKMTLWQNDIHQGERERGRLRYSENNRHGVIRAWQGTAGGEEYWVKHWRVERKRERDEESEAVSCHLLLCVCRDTETVLWHSNNAMTTAFHSMIAVYLLPTGTVCFRLFVYVSLTSLTIHWIGNFSIINVSFWGFF